VFLVDGRPSRSPRRPQLLNRFGQATEESVVVGHHTVQALGYIPTVSLGEIENGALVPDRCVFQKHVHARSLFSHSDTVARSLVSHGNIVTRSLVSHGDIVASNQTLKRMEEVLILRAVCEGFSKVPLVRQLALEIVGACLCAGQLDLQALAAIPCV
jgi:hypothetical protein